MTKNPLSFLTNKQALLVEEEVREEGYCVLQVWTNKGEKDYRVLKDTVIVTPTRVFDRIKWVFKKVIKR